MLDDPQTRLRDHGPDVLTDSELLSFLLTRGAPGPAAVTTARDLLQHAGSLAGLARLGERELVSVPGIGPGRASRVQALTAMAQRIAERPIARGAVFAGPRAIYEGVRVRLGRSQTERFLVVLLDARLRKLGEVQVCSGGRNTVSVLPCDVFEPAVRARASAVVLVHNHPSGDPTPSPEDVALTDRLAAAGDLLGISVQDHVVIGDGRFASMAEMGLFDPAPPGVPNLMFTSGLIPEWEPPEELEDFPTPPFP